MAFVEFEQRGHVGLITINRPEVLNALNLEVIEQLDDILLRAESQEDVHVIVITGAGRSFVAGADIGEMVNYTADDAKRFIVDSGFDPVYGARPLKRFIQHKVETLIAKEIIGKDLAPGTAMEIYFENGALAIREK